MVPKINAARHEPTYIIYDNLCQYVINGENKTEVM